MSIPRLLPLVLAAAAAGCSPSGKPASDNLSAEMPSPEGNGAGAPDAVATSANDALPPLNPPAPGTPGGLPDDRTPVSEAPFTEDSAQGAANVLQSYFALVEQRRFAEAQRLWSDAPPDFAAGFEPYSEYHAQIGAPGRLEGAAGSVYVEVPVQVYGRRRNGETFNMSGTMTLRRANDIPGATAEQRRWRIYRSDLQPTG